MDAPGHPAAIAYTYAWWLTGDDNAARAAVLAAGRSAPGGAGDVAALLRAVRAQAGGQPTMCPASELALLHDAHQLPLDVAAELAAIPAAEARAELAHGRLEALLETVAEPFAHPERLGGLAVGNPPDVAHARTCASCAEAQQLLRRGREEVVALAPQPVPPGLLEALAPARGPAGGATADAPEGPAPPAAPRQGTPSAREPLPGASPAQRRGTLLVAFVVTAAVLLVLLNALSGDPSAAGLPAAIL